MRILTIEASSLQSARGFCDALSSFGAEILDCERCAVRISAGETREIVAVLNAIQQYVVDREHAPTLVDLDGSRYVMDPADPM